MKDNTQPRFLPDNRLNMRILVVEENPIAQERLYRHLRQLPIRLDIVNSGMQAFDAMEKAVNRQDCYHIAIINLQLQGLDGEVLGNAIKNDPLYRNMILILLHSKENQIHQERFKTAGFSACFPQQVEGNILNDAVLSLAHSLNSGETPRFLTIETLYPVYETATLAGQSVLVVDDNLINRQAAVDMLYALGCSVNAASDGQHAVRLCTLHPYDAILMDCYMPEMDGYETTQRIRRLPHGKAIYIFGISANILNEEKERCCAAGMNDLLTKPLRPVAMRTMLKNYLLRARHPIAQAIDSNNDEIAAMQEIFGKDFIKLIQLYQTDCPQRINAMHAAYHSKNLNALAKAVHALGGSSASIGAHYLATLCKKLELAIKDVSDNECCAQITVIEEEYQKTSLKLQVMLQTALTS